MNCRICSNPAANVFALHSRRHPIEVPVFHCIPCKAYFSNGGPVDYEGVDLVDFYTSNAGSIRARYRKIFSYLESLRSPGRFLDIGAGMGFSLEVAKQHGWLSRGIEPNRHLAHDAQKRGLDVVNSYLDKTTVGSYDLILIDNVLEHVPDPAEFLREAARLLDKNGMMLITIPPVDWLRRMLGHSAYVRDHVERPQINIFEEVDEHVNIMGRQAMSRLIHSIGLHLTSSRFHHSKIYNNALYRACRLDDGYYVVTKDDC
jgi:SAM-dependent methyltransferase